MLLDRIGKNASKDKVKKWKSKILKLLKEDLHFTTEDFKLYKEKVSPVIDYYINEIWRIGFNNPMDYAHSLFLQKTIPKNMLKNLGYSIKSKYREVIDLIQELS